MIEYDPHNWVDHLFDIKGSVVGRIAPRVLMCVAWAIVVAVLDHWVIEMRMPSVAHALVGIALGLLLVFRTNASYDRFWEGRRQWGGIVNASRNIGRGAVALMAGAPDLRERVFQLIAAFPYTLMHRLRDGGGIGRAAQLLPARDVAALADCHVPLAVMLRVGTALVEARRRGVLTDHEQVMLDTQASLLVDAAGACDRIHKTPLPFAYVVHLRRALILYLFTLPFGTLDGFGLCSPLVTLLIAYVLLGVEEIGVEIEDPFGYDDNDLPLHRFCESIERDINNLRKEIAILAQGNGEVHPVAPERHGITTLPASPVDSGKPAE